MKSSPHLLLATLATSLACLWNPTSARSIAGLPGLDPVQSTISYDATVDSVAALDIVEDLDHDGRQLTAFTSSKLVTNIASRLLDAFLGAGAGTLVSGIAGSGAVPDDFGALIDNAVKEIDRIVGEKIVKAFNDEKKSLLDSLSQRVQEYVRRRNLDVSFREVQGMLTDASELLAFFEDNGVVTNGAFQTALALRLALQLEQLHLDQLLGESEATLERVRRNIRAQARAGKKALDTWRATFRPSTVKTDASVKVPCPLNLNRKCIKSTRERTVKVCTVVSSFPLKRPKVFCKSKTCRSGHFRKVIRGRRMRRCVNAFKKDVESDVLDHAEKVLVPEFRKLNEKTVFGAGIERFLADLDKVVNMQFADVSLPDVKAA